MTEAVTSVELSKQVYLPSTLQQEQRDLIKETTKKYQTLLGLKDIYTLTNILSNFEICWQVAYENHELEYIKELIDGKNYLERIEIVSMVMVSKNKKKKFDLDEAGLIPFNRVCWNCHGAGETYKFYRGTETSICRVCEGQGVTDKKNCPTCNATGVKNGKKCKICNGTKKISPICRACRGKKLFTRHPLIPKLETTTYCDKCEGRGFPLPKKKTLRKPKEPSNPVITKDLAEQIKSGTVE